MITEENPLPELLEPVMCRTTHKTVEKIQTNQDLATIWATVDHISVRLTRGLRRLQGTDQLTDSKLLEEANVPVRSTVYDCLFERARDRVRCRRPRDWSREGLGLSGK